LVKSKSKPDGLLKRIRGTKQQKDDPELQTLLQEIQSNPDNIRMRRKLAEYYLKTGENAHAIEQFLIVASAYAGREFYGKGAAVYKQVLQLDPNNIDVYIKLAELYKQLGLVREVAENLQKAAALYQAQGKSREALNIQRKMLDLDPGNTIERIRLGQTLLEKGYTTEAVAEFLRVADVFEQQNKHKELQKLLEGVLDRGLENFDILHRLTELYRAQGHPELALARLAKLSGELAGSSSALELTAELAEELGKPAVAVKALERAAELYRQSNRTDRVKTLCRHILQLDETNSYAADWLDEYDSQMPDTPAVEEFPAVEELPATTDLPEETPAADQAPMGERMIEEVSLDFEPAYEAPESSVMETSITEITLDDETVLVERPSPERKPAIEEPQIDEIALEEEAPIVEDVALPEEPTAEPEPEPVVEPEPEPVPEPEPPAEMEPIEEEPALPEVPERIDLSFIDDAEIENRVNEALEPYFQADHLDLVFTYLNRAAEQNPEAMPVFAKLTDLYREAGAREKLIVALRRLAAIADKREAGKALERLLTELVDIAPDDIEARVKLADLYGEDRIDQAIPLFFELADRYRELAQPAQSEAMLERILALDPLSKKAHESLVDLYAGLNRRDEEIEELALLADMAAEDGAVGEAEEYWQRILEYRPADEQIRENLLRLYETSGDAQKAQALLRRLADEYIQAGKLDEAIEKLARLAESDQENLAVLRRLKDLYLEKGDSAQALEQLRQLADRCVSLEDYPAAIEALREVLRLDPQDRLTREGLVDLYLQAENSASAVEEIAQLAEASAADGDLEKALEQLVRLLELDPGRESARLRQKDLLLKAGRRDEAVALLYELADEWVKANRFPEAENALREIVTGDPGAAEARLALKKLYLRQGDTEKAIAELVELAERSEAAGEYRIAIGYWGEVSGLDAENLEARRGIARLHLAAGETDSAVAELLSLAEWQERHKRRDEAIETLRGILQQVADNEQATERLTKLYLETGHRDQAVELLYECGERALAAERSDRAREFLERIIQVAPEHAPARVRLKEVLLRLNRPAEAIEQLFALTDLWTTAGEDDRVEGACREILTLDPRSSRAAVALKEIYLKTNRPEPALNTLAQTIARLREVGQTEEAKSLAGEMLLIAEDDRRALETMAELDLETGDTDGAVDHYLHLATLCEADGEFADVELYLRKIVELDEQHAEARQRYKDLLLARGDTAEAIEQLLALAELTADRNDGEGARAYYHEILALEPDNEAALEKYVELMVFENQGLEATGEMYYIAKLAEARADFPQAERYLRQLLELKPDDEPALELLAQIYIAAGDTGQAINELFKLEDAAAKAGDQEKALGIVDRILELDDELLGALQRKAELEKALARTDRAVSAWLRLADIQRTADLGQEAERSLRQALALAPDDGTVHEKLCDILVEQEKVPAAVEEILRFNRRAIEAADHEQIAIVAGRILELDSHNEQAHRMLVDAAKGRGDQEAAIAELFVLADLYQAGERREDLEEALKEALTLRQTERRATERLVEIYLDDGRREEALALLVALGDAYRRLEKFAEARGAYERVLEFEDGHFGSLERLKDTYLAEDNTSEAVEVLFRTLAAADAVEDPEKAITVLEEILVLDARHEEAIDELKNRYLKAGRTERAVALLFDADRNMTGLWIADRQLANIEEILALDAENEAALRRLVELHQEAGRDDQAVDVLFKMADLVDRAGVDRESLLREIIDIDAANLPAHEQLLALAREQNDPGLQAEELLAVADLQQARGNAAGAEQALGELQELDGHELQALAAKEKLFADLGRKDRLLETRFEKAAFFTEQNRIVEAENCYRGIITEFGENLLARESLILLYERGNRLIEAADQAMILAERARKNGEFEEAVTRYRQVLTFTKDNLAARRYLKDLFIETDRIDEAVEEWQALAAAARTRDDVGGLEEALEGILKLCPDNHEARRELIDLFRNSSREIPAVHQLLSLAEQLIREQQVDEAIARLQEARQLRPDDEPVNRLLKEAYLLAGDKQAAVAMLFNMYNIEMLDHHRHNAERCLKEILELDPQNAEAKEKVFALFKTGLSKEEKIADLLARVGEQTAAGNLQEARLALKQVLVLDPGHAEARNLLAEMPAVEEEAIPGIEEPLADDVFAVHHITENVDQAEEDIDLNWDAAQEEGELPPESARAETAPAPAARREMEDVDVFGALEEETPETVAAEAEVEGLRETGGELKELIEQELMEEAPSLKLEETVAPAPEKETFTLEEPPTEEPVLEEPLVLEGVTAAEPVLEPESAAPASESVIEDQEDFSAEAAEETAITTDDAMPSLEREDELTRAVDAFLSEAGEEKQNEEQIPKIQTVEDEYGTEEIGEVKVIEDLVTDSLNVFRPETEPGKGFETTETSADDFLSETETPELAAVKEPDIPAPQVAEAPKPSPARGRILEDFRPFTDSLPDETLGEQQTRPTRQKKAATDDLLAELIGGLEAEPAAERPAAEPENAGDLVGDVFGEEKQEPAGDGIFESFISSLGVKSDTARSAQEHYNFGIAYREMDENEKAIEEFEKAMLINDETLTFQINHQLGQCYAALEKHEMAAEYLEVAMTEGTNDEQTMLDLTFDLALSLRLAGEFEEARNYFLQVDAKSKNYRNTKAQIKACKKKDRSLI